MIRLPVVSTTPMVRTYAVIENCDVFRKSTDRIGFPSAELLVAVTLALSGKAPAAPACPNKHADHAITATTHRTMD
jgi:hypothetical protein